MAAEYLEQLIKHICLASKDFKLVTFNVCDLLRSKCVGNKEEIRKVFEQLNAICVVTRVKDRLETSNHDFLVNFCYKNILC